MRQQRMDQKTADVKKRTNFEDNVKHEFCGQAPRDEKIVTRVMHRERCGQNQYCTVPATLKHNMSRRMWLVQA
jgi:hypothetical protein